MKLLESKWPFIIYTLVITVLSLVPRDSVPSTEWTMMEGVDKAVHALLYGIMYVLWHYMNKPSKWSSTIRGVVICAVWGALMEILQALMSYGRAFEWFDLIANVVGVLIAFIIFRTKET